MPKDNDFAAFQPRCSRVEAAALSKRYDASEDASALAAGEAIRGGDFSSRHLRTIFQWKTKDRGKSRLDRNSESEIEEALRMAASAQHPRSAISVLSGLHGVGVPVASAIATAIDPNAYTIIDFRALEALGNPTKDRSITFYLEYLSYCINLSSEWVMSLRDVDRALWQWSEDQGKLRALTTDPRPPPSARGG